ncbi:preprotein translocase subunit SecY [Weissella viridescens]|uniref:Preprotein translocase subunit SecY n=1 Tax=Weissella viridescens TaxID=1629 RepID=A0A380NZJ7_WEIVI|nr:preprotein translocase subunit SecY [Weissella viridescens]
MTGMIIWQAISSLGLDAISHLSQRQVSYIQKWIALGLAALQAIQIVYFIKNALITLPIFGNSKMATMAVVYLMLLSGTMLSIFLGDLLSQHGLGGSSLLILPGVILGLPNMITSGWGPFNYSLSYSHLVKLDL